LKALACLCAVVLLAAPASAREAAAEPIATPSPYVGQEQRAVKALSADEVEGLLAGAGLGYAKAAELNHYPGPRHVLDLGHELGLTDQQRAAVQASLDRMQQRAQDLGRKVIDAETALDRAFADGTVSAEDLERHVAEIATLRGHLRTTHLAAHLETRAVLSDEQVERYDRLRGYGEAGAGHHPEMHGHSGHGGHGMRGTHEPNDGSGGKP
jgi:hypothetical protein